LLFCKQGLRRRKKSCGSSRVIISRISRLLTALHFYRNCQKRLQVRSKNMPSAGDRQSPSN